MKLKEILNVYASELPLEDFVASLFAILNATNINQPKSYIELVQELIDRKEGQYV